MIAKFPGTCTACGGPIRKGEEIDYDSSTKTAKHAGCGPGIEDAEALADRLGFRTHRDLLLLPDLADCGSAGRPERET